MSMTSSRPYVMRALYEWILENDCTPYVLVNAEEEGVNVPAQYVKDGQIVLNISPAAVVDLVIGNDALYFNGRFGGMPADIYVPMTGVIGISFSRPTRQEPRRSRSGARSGSSS